MLICGYDTSVGVQKNRHAISFVNKTYNRNVGTTRCWYNEMYGYNVMLMRMLWNVDMRLWAMLLILVVWCKWPLIGPDALISLSVINLPAVVIE